MSIFFLGIAASGFVAGAILVLPYHHLAVARLRREHAKACRAINNAWIAETAERFACEYQSREAA